MVLIESSDLLALIRSFTTMFDQLNGCAVSREWNQMVAAHPLMLRVLDFGNPLTFARSPFQRIIKFAGSRLRRLKLCDFGHFGSLHHLHHPNYDLNVLLLPVVINLERLEIVGHITGDKLRLFLDVLTRSTAPQITIQLATCSCCLDQHSDSIQNHPRASQIRLQSGVSHFTASACGGCGITHRWCRRCPGCNVLHCSYCNKSWRWANKFNMTTGLLPCLCSRCWCFVDHAASWNCSSHCNDCHVF